MKKAKKERQPYSLTKSEVSNKKFGTTQERKVAKEIGGKLTPMSGAIKGFGGDILLNKKFTIDLKSLKQKTKQYIVTEDTLHKLEVDAKSEIPVLLLNFTGKRNLQNTKWVCLPLEDFNAINKNGERNN